MQEDKILLRSGSNLEDIIPASERTVRDYCEQLELTRDELRQRILDVGSGRSAKFGNIIRELGLGDQIYSIELNQGRPDRGNLVTGNAQSLPFRNGVFDLIISNAAFPFFVIKDAEVKTQLAVNNTVPAKDKIRIFLDEFFRVLKIGGKIKLGRVADSLDIPLQKKMEACFREVLADLEQQGKIKSVWKKKNPLTDTKNSEKKIAELYLVTINLLK